MRGNAIAGGLAYAPANYSDRVNPADVAEWANVDSVATHTATEAHGLWDVEVAPGAAAQRVLEAGTHRYACRFHPDMRGTFGVTPLAFAEIRPHRVVKRVRVEGRKRRKKVRRTVFRRSVRAHWGAGQTENAFDVQRRRVGSAEWQPWLTATTAVDGAFRARAGQAWEIRARLRDRADAARATDWSPAASVTVG